MNDDTPELLIPTADARGVKLRLRSVVDGFVCDVFDDGADGETPRTRRQGLVRQLRTRLSEVPRSPVGGKRLVWRLWAPEGATIPAPLQGGEAFDESYPGLLQPWTATDDELLRLHVEATAARRATASHASPQSLNALVQRTSVAAKMIPPSSPSIHDEPARVVSDNAASGRRPKAAAR